MERTLIGDLAAKKGEAVLIQGWVSVRRDQGKMVFFDFRDRSGSVQGVVLPKSEAIEIAKEVRNEYVVSVEGKVSARPEKNIKADAQNGDIELEVTGITIISKSEIPFELGSEVNLDTYLDHMPFTLRSEKAKQIFKVQEAIIQGFRDGMKAQDFTEFQAPALGGGDAEGGAAAFEGNYYYDKKAYLAPGSRQGRSAGRDARHHPGTKTARSAKNPRRLHRRAGPRARARARHLRVGA